MASKVLCALKDTRVPGVEEPGVRRGSLLDAELAGAERVRLTGDSLVSVFGRVLVEMSSSWPSMRFKVLKIMPRDISFLSRLKSANRPTYSSLAREIYTWWPSWHHTCIQSPDSCKDDKESPRRSVFCALDRRRMPAGVRKSSKANITTWNAC